MDVLADFLNTAGVTALVESLPSTDQSWTLSGPAAISPSGRAHLILLCVAAGEYSMLENETRKSLICGDVVFLPRDSSCRLESLRAESALIVGSIVFRAGEMALATLSLQDATILRGEDHPDCKELAMRLVSEVQFARGGWQQVAECLATSLFITSLRASECSDSDKGGGKGWLRALVDPEIGNALRLMHQSPEHRWTVAELADQLLISRSAFADRFKRITGRPPLEYLTWWRLQRAAARLRSGNVATMFELARNSGYRSEAAFSKAFRREFGIPPGEVRRQAMAQRETPSQLQLEIKKRTPFEFPEQEVGLNLVKSFESIRRPFEDLLGSHGLSGAEYNILRILRGTNTAMTLEQVEDHLLIPHSNLPERLEQLVSKRCIYQLPDTDTWRISSTGEDILKKLDEPTISIHQKQFAHFSSGEIAELNRLLVKLRTPAS